MSDFQATSYFFPCSHRSEPALSCKATCETSYAELNDDYMNNGVTPYTAQFLKRMADSSAGKAYYKRCSGPMF